MRLRSIPPKTMLDVEKEKKGIGPLRIDMGAGPLRPPGEEVSAQKFQPKVHRKPRVWSYATRPIFKRIKEPLVDVFNGTKEACIIIDLGNFNREEITFGMENGKYVIRGRHNEQEFKKEIELPQGIDIDNIEEHFKAGILELKLSRKKAKKGKKK